MITESPTTPPATDAPLAEGLVTLDGRAYYAIPDVDHMPPFLMSVVSDGDRWMFASSSGALTAGRRDAGQAIFPYETDDRLHTAAGRIGPVTVLRVDGRHWQPFATDRAPGRRHLFTSVAGDALVVEESHPDLGLTVRSRWASCDRFGFVRTVTLTNPTGVARRVEVLDGVVNVLPYGLDPVTTQRLGNLANAYKRSELVDPSSLLAVFSLESPVSDRAEPEEVLRATVAWATGFDAERVHLDPDAVARFRRGEACPPAGLVTGRPGAYLLEGAVELAPGASSTWHVVIDAARDQSDVVALRRTLTGEVDLEGELAAATAELTRIMALADADQCTGDEVATAHHVANVTYNVMRGGVPLLGYRVDRDGLARFVARRNRAVAERHATWLSNLPEGLDRSGAIDLAAATGDVHLLRLVREYLPFSFSRRHGDPSRPWNQFSIRVRDEAGEPVVHYEGNWRDVFQNWEALCATHPHYLPGVISVFVNASTADGFNPYRITTDGIDWEVPDPDDPWANIGYWGDHQITYLLRLIESCERHLPGGLREMLGERACTFADVPYRIASYRQLLADPKATIGYDHEAAARSDERVAGVGGDGRLLVDAAGEIVTVTLLEKLVVTALARLSNFVPGGGIWMNTQRPEWNDANNALVGYGLSMVTTYHLRRFLDHLARLAADAPAETAMSAEVAQWLRSVSIALADRPVDAACADDGDRKELMDALGTAFSDYRRQVYDAGLDAGAEVVTAAEVTELCRVALAHVDHTIRDARRPDGLVESYSLLDLGRDGTTAGVRRLPEMLEGQVAVLGSGVLTPAEQADLVEALFRSDMHRADQHTFMLYPARRLPSFLDKNVVPDAGLDTAPVLADLLAAGDTSIVRRDPAGTVRFHPDLVDAPHLDAALDALGESWSTAVAEERVAIHDLYEAVFHHRSFLGRSGSMYGYEGIGSIYWHMVTKLLLAVQEAALEARDGGAPADIVERLVTGYFRVREGLGHKKSAAEFGAVPTDPYSHTPAHAGAQQPGMTGAVKEELLARPLELGVRVADGEIVLDPLLLGVAEPVEHGTTWSPIGVSGERRAIPVPAGSWGFTLCQVPIVVEHSGEEPQLEVVLADGTVHSLDGARLGRRWSGEVFARSGAVAWIRATI